MVQMKNLLLRLACGILLMLISIKSIAQAAVQTPRYYTAMNPSTNGFYEYLPQGYSAGSSFPLLLYIHGIGECGDGSPAQLYKVLDASAPMLINQGIFPATFTNWTGTYSFIVLSPQFIGWPSPTDIDQVLDYAVSNYKVDINRIYVTGLSMGGGVTWDYASNNMTYANRVAAIVPVCGASGPWIDKTNIMAAANLPVWATHNDSDYVVPSSYTIGYVDGMNSTVPSPPNPLARKTLFHSFSHDAWSQTYDLNYTENGMNVYEWMLQYKRSFTPLPVSGLEFNISKKDNDKVQLQWKTFSELNNRGFEIQRSADGTNFETKAFVNSRSVNGSGADYSYIDAAPLKGKSYYRLKQVDLNGNSKYSQIRFIDLSNSNAVTVYPNPVAGMLNISSSYNFTQAQLIISNIQGQVVKKSLVTGNGNISLPVDELKPAVYNGELSEGNVKLKFRFIKQ